MDTCTHPDHSMKIKGQMLRDVSSSCMTWQNLSALSSIKQTQLNGNHLHLSGIPFDKILIRHDNT